MSCNNVINCIRKYNVVSGFHPIVRIYRVINYHEVLIQFVYFNCRGEGVVSLGRRLGLETRVWRRFYISMVLTMAEMALAIWTGFPRSVCFSLDSSRRYTMAGRTTSSNWPKIQRFPSGRLEEPVHTFPLSLRTYSCLRASPSKYTASSARGKAET